MEPEDRYLKVDDLKVRYWAQGEKGSPVILIHGLGASCEFWQYNMEALSRSHRVYAFDLPGFGRSDKQVGEFSLTYASHFLAGFMEALGLERASLVGNSMGGVIALQFALQFPQILNKLVLVDSGGLGREINPLFSLLHLLSPLGGLALPLLRLPSLRRRVVRMAWGTIVYDPQAIDPHFLDTISENLQLPGAKEAFLAVVRVGIDWRGQNMRLLGALRRRLPEIEAPTLIIWGAQDRLIPPAHAHMAQQMIRNSKLVIFDRCGHVPQVERPQEFNQAVLDFLK